VKTLVVYYSRTGVTQTVADRLAAALAADVERLIDTKARKGYLGFIRAGKDAAMKKLIPIEPPGTDPADYDLVLVGTPVWANTLSSAVRMYLTDYGQAIKRAAVFCTTMRSGIDSTLSVMADMIGGQTVARMGLRQKDVRKGRVADQVRAFVADVAS